MLQQRSIVIVGGGVVGFCTAWYCLQKGHQVTVIERGAPEHDCCSKGNAGLIVPSHIVPLAAPGMVRLGVRMMFNPESPFFFRPRLDPDLWRWAWNFWKSSTAQHVEKAAPLLRDLNLASRQLYRQLATASGWDFGLQQKGLLMLCRSHQGLEEEQQTAQLARNLNLAAEYLSPDQAAHLNPHVRMDVLGAVCYPDDCHLNPRHFMQKLATHAEREGVRVVWNAEAQGWRTQNDRVETLQTSRGDFNADEFVVAGGSWSPQLLAPLGIRLLVQPGKGYNVTLSNPRFTLSMPAILTEARVAVTPLHSQLRLGGTMEFAGLDDSITQPRVQGIIKSIPPYFPDFKADDFAGLPVWRGFRPCSPDGLPFLGRTKRYSNLLLCTGHAMTGLSLGPISGMLVAQLLSNEQPSHDLSLFHPDRFS